MQDEQFVNESIKWLIDHDQIDSGPVVDCVLGLSLMCDRAVKSARFSLDRKEKNITVQLFLSRWSMVFRNKGRIKDKLFVVLAPLMAAYNLKCEFKVYKK